jgi:hypothetical protein
MVTVSQADIRYLCNRPIGFKTPYNLTVLHLEFLNRSALKNGMCLNRLCNILVICILSLVMVIIISHLMWVQVVVGTSENTGELTRKQEIYAHIKYAMDQFTTEKEKDGLTNPEAQAALRSIDTVGLTNEIYEMASLVNRDAKAYC